MVTKKKQHDVKHQTQKKARKYFMLCKLDKTKMNYIKENPHTAHFFCHYQNVLVCDDENKDNCNSPGITYSREFTPEVYTGKDPHLSDILNHSDLKHTLSRITKVKGINSRWIELYELIHHVLASLLSDISKSKDIRIKDEDNMLMSPLEYYIKHNKLDVTLRNVNEHYNLIMTNEMPKRVEHVTVLKQNLPLNDNVLESLSKLECGVTVFDASVIDQTTPIYFVLTPEGTLNQCDFIDTYSKIMNKRNNYVNKLIFYMKNIDEIPWQHVEEVISTMATKTKNWLERNKLNSL